MGKISCTPTSSHFCPKAGSHPNEKRPQHRLPRSLKAQVQAQTWAKAILVFWLITFTGWPLMALALLSFWATCITMGLLLSQKEEERNERAAAEDRWGPKSFLFLSCYTKCWERSPFFRPGRWTIRMPTILRYPSLLRNSPDMQWKSDPGCEDYGDHEKQAKDEALQKGPVCPEITWFSISFSYNSRWVGIPGRSISLALGFF